MPVTAKRLARAIFGFGAVSTIWLGTHGPVLACDGCATGSRPSASPPSRAASDRDMVRPQLRLQDEPLNPQFGGQVLSSRWHYFETVFRRDEIRVYVYSPSRRPINAWKAKGTATLKVASSGQTLVLPVQAAMDSGTAYLKAVVDLGRIENGDLTVTFDLQDLPFREENTVRFAQTCLFTETIAENEPAPAAESQASPVGSHPQFVSTGNFPSNSPPATRGQQGSVAVAICTEDDRPAVMAQGRCLVSGQLLGGPSAPIKLTSDGQVVFVCCRSCVPHVLQDPARYFGVQGQGPLEPNGAQITRAPEFYPVTSSVSFSAGSR